MWVNINMEIFLNFTNRSDNMTVDFEKIKNDFINADVDEKIRIYTTTQGLTTEQFRELLKYYPIKHLSKLEKALG